MQGLHLGEAEDGALRFRDYVLADKARIVKKSLPGQFVWLTLFYTRGSEIVVLHVMVPQPYRFSPCFFT